jgi:hypothetical protein
MLTVLQELENITRAHLQTQSMFNSTSQFPSYLQAGAAPMASYGMQQSMLPSMYSHMMTQPTMAMYSGMGMGGGLSYVPAGSEFGGEYRGAVPGAIAPPSEYGASAFGSESQYGTAAPGSL